MRTRRSWRNQERIFKYLFEPEKPTPLEPSKRCWDCFYYPKGGRNTGTCKHLNMKVRGEILDQSCFKSRVTLT